MTSKRFQEMVDSDMQVIGFFDDVTDEHYFSFEEVIDKLNELADEINELKQELYEEKKKYLIETADINDKSYLKYEIESLKEEIFGKYCSKCNSKMVEHDDGATIRWYCKNCGYTTWFARPFGDLGF